MKKLALVFTMMLMAWGGYAQNKNVRKAEKAMEDGDLKEAKTLIDQAAEYEKTKDDGKTFYIKGQVYADIAAKQPELAENALEEASKALHHVLDLEKEGSNYYTMANLKIQQIWGNYLNAGSQYYNKGVYDSALYEFQQALKVLPKDTTALLYAGISAQQNHENKKALPYYYRLIDTGYKDKDVYNSIISIERYQNKDMDKAIEVTRDAMKAFPDDKDYPKQEINLLIAADKTDEARQKIENAIEKEPKNANLYFNLGYLYEKLEKPDKAKEAYKKALDINPDYLEANFNYGVFFYNQAASILKDVADMDLQTYKKKGKEKEAEAKEILKKALPYFEKCQEIKPNEVSVLNTLQTIYSRLKMTDKLQKVNDKLDSLDDK